MNSYDHFKHEFIWIMNSYMNLGAPRFQMYSAAAAPRRRPGQQPPTDSDHMDPSPLSALPETAYGPASRAVPAQGNGRSQEGQYRLGRFRPPGRLRPQARSRLQDRTGAGYRISEQRFGAGYRISEQRTGAGYRI